MAVSQPLSTAPDGAEYLRAILRAPVYEVAQVTPLQVMEKSPRAWVTPFWLSAKTGNRCTALNCAALTRCWLA